MDELERSIKEPIRAGISIHDRWRGPDKGLIWCWERGRQKAIEDPELSDRAKAGELVILAWSGGVEEKKKADILEGTLQYFATWQGLRESDLMIDLHDPIELKCAKTLQRVVFREKPLNQ